VSGEAAGSIYASDPPAAETIDPDDLMMPPEPESPTARVSDAARPTPGWVAHLVGIVLGGLAGLGLGYVVLSLLLPDAFPTPW
jgi:hypothetical protein